MTDEPKAKVLDFILKRKQASPAPDPNNLYFGFYTLAREDSILMGMPLFELILMRLTEGPPAAQQLAAALAEKASTEIVKPPV